jgi:hypothetical protein
MDDQGDTPPKKTQAEVMAELMARKKGAQTAGQAGAPGRRKSEQAERAAAARSASKSKPALRKG